MHWDVLRFTGMYWDVVVCSVMLGVCSRMFWDVLGCFGMFWDILGCTWMYWDVLGFSGMFWDVLGCTGMYWNVLGCSGIFRDFLGCTGVSVTSVQSIGSTKCRANLDKTSVSE